MSKRLFVGNLSYDTTEDSLKQAFEASGRELVKVQVVLDRETGRSRGFAFVEFSSEEDASAARDAMDGQEVDGRRLRIDLAQDRPPRRDGPGGPPRGRAPREGGGGFRGPREGGGGFRNEDARAGGYRDGGGGGGSRDGGRRGGKGSRRGGGRDEFGDGGSRDRGGRRGGGRRGGGGYDDFGGGGGGDHDEW